MSRKSSSAFHSNYTLSRHDAPDIIIENLDASGADAIDAVDPASSPCWGRRTAVGRDASTSTDDAIVVNGVSAAALVNGLNGTTDIRFMDEDSGETVPSDASVFEEALDPRDGVGDGVGPQLPGKTDAVCHSSPKPAEEEPVPGYWGGVWVGLDVTGVVEEGAAEGSGEGTTEAAETAGGGSPSTQEEEGAPAPEEVTRVELPRACASLWEEPELLPYESAV